VLIVPLVAAAVLPSLLLVWFFHARDTFPEPPRTLWATFGFGCLSVIPAVALAIAIEPALATMHAWSGAAVQAFVLAALCEEAAKLSVLLGYSFRHSAFDEPMDGIVYGATASLGFATLENTLYVVQGGFALALARGLLSVPGHATYGAVMGYYVGRARFDRGRRWRLVSLGLLAAVALHGWYDFPLMLLDNVVPPDDAERLPADAGQVGDPVLSLLLLAGIGAVVFGWTWVLTLVRRVRREQAARDVLPDVVPAPAIGPAEAGHAPSPGQRIAAGLAVIAGALVASAGGLLIATAIGLALAGEVDPGDGPYLAVGIAILGGLPVAAGTALFVIGIRWLNRLRPGAAAGGVSASAPGDGEQQRADRQEGAAADQLLAGRADKRHHGHDDAQRGDERTERHGEAGRRDAAGEPR
jgi:hypothetical protein